MTEPLLRERASSPQKADSRAADAGSHPAKGSDVPAPRPRAVLVLGMHRSGTSALTRMISLLGADLPAKLMQPVKNNNETGFWESLDAYYLNEEILAAGGSRWDDWLPVAPAWYSSRPARELKASALALLRREFAQSPLFVLKDPRICRLLPFWLEVLADAGASTSCVIITRNPLEVAASLERRDGLSRAKSLAVWLRHVLDAELGTRSLPRSFVTYDGLMRDWRGTAAAIAAGTRVAWPRRSAQAETAIDGFLNARHRHHAIPHTALEQDADVPDWVKGAYDCLVQFSLGGESPALRERLDRIRSELDRACLAFGPLVRALEHELATAKASAELAHAKASCEQNLALARTARLHELSAALHTERARNADLTSALERQRTRLTELERDRDALCRRLDSLLCSAWWELAAPVRRLEQRAPRALRRAAGGLKLLWWTLTLRLPRWLRLRRIMRRVIGSGLFDPDWYARKYPASLATADLRPVEHWLRSGWIEGQDPSPLFDTSWYLEQNPDVGNAGINPLVHYLTSGAHEGRDPHPLFDTSWYLGQSPDVEAAGINALVHFMQSGAHEGRDPHPLFDTSWYLAQNPDVAAAGLNPLVHYVRSGGAEGRDPHPLFDGAWYLREYPQVATADTPLADYLLRGAAAGRDPNPLFRTAVYGEKNLPGGDPAEALIHFAASGQAAVPGAYRSGDVLLALQERFRASTALGVVADHRDKPARYAVYLQCGSGSVHAQWLGGRPRPWDLIVNHYDLTFLGGIDCDLELLQTGALVGTKFTAMCQLINQRPALLASYDYILLLDDDIEIAQEGITRLFEVGTEHGLDLLQASLSPDSSCSHDVFLTRGRPGLRPVSAVEIMMPVLSRRALAIAGHLFCQSVSGWGIDVVMAKLVREQGGRSAVVDEIVARHTKPVDPAHGSYYRMLQSASIDPYLELRQLQAVYGAPLAFVECL